LLLVAACGGGSETTGTAESSASTGFFFSGASSGSASCIGGGGGAGHGGGGGAPSECASAPKNVSFASDVVPIFAGCTGELCHEAPTFTSIVGKQSSECCGMREIVRPGDPRHSYLLDKLEGVRLCSGAAMPLGGPSLPSSDEATLVGWICEGAPDN
jgi:hypothetical protein